MSKMLFLLLITLVAFPGFVFCQDEHTSKTEKFKPSVVFPPDATYSLVAPSYPAATFSKKAPPSPVGTYSEKASASPISEKKRVDMPLLVPWPEPSVRGESPMEQASSGKSPMEQASSGKSPMEQASSGKSPMDQVSAGKSPMDQASGG